MGTRDPASDLPLISCVIIFLNGEAFIAEAIESVLAQTWPNWELILVDDGTTDGASDIARRYCEAHPDRIRLIAHEAGRNLGMSASRNAGVRASRGKYVAYLDADDIWLPERLAVHVEALESHPHVAMTAASTFFWRSWNPDAAPWWRPWASVDISHGTGLGDRRITHAPDTATHFLERRGGGMPGVCSVLVRRSVLEAVGGGEDSFRTLYEDQVLMFKIFLEHPVMGIGRILDLYRQHPDSACESEGRTASDRAARPRFLAWLRSRVEELEISDPDLRAALEAEIRRAEEPAPPVGLFRRVLDVWLLESRLAVIKIFTPPRYNLWRRRIGLTPLANDMDAEGGYPRPSASFGRRRALSLASPDHNCAEPFRAETSVRK